MPFSGMIVSRRRWQPERGASGCGPRTSATSTVAHDLVEAARLLMWESGGPVFTVTQVVAAAGTSLKSFYRCFESKDELLVALFDDDARRGAEALADGRRPRDRARSTGCASAVEGLFGFITVDGRLPYAAALVREHLRLVGVPARRAAGRAAALRRHLPGRAGRGARRAGWCTPVDDAGRDARTLFHLVVSHLHALICHQIDDSPTERGRRPVGVLRRRPATLMKTPSLMTALP